ncbi:rubredoxin-NAD+ reductase [Nitrosomonas sp. PY1]|uniref:NAD(P)/FAD-dependent oxidoreductase n=1 Tax=Nitrosomonas sp. PY1 TaxID=1803906 RepID=UPI001FC7C13E|nr:FAD-dependent oxidoreductase [Nitrosomonas sp. PY1]GKS68406.1 rubredoxin-NAD+ reductase [Nitrosomonas sp. PY1]
MNNTPVVIVGSGLAGYATARELRKLNATIPITMLAADRCGFYSKPMLSNALSTGKDPASLLNGNAEQMRSQLKIDIRPNHRVVSIDTTRNVIQLTNEEEVSYSQLVLAIGADQIRLPMQGNAVGKIYTVNNLDEYQVFHTALSGKKCVCIIGAGLIGCEFANDLVTAGYRVHVIDISLEPLGRLLPPKAGAFFRHKLEAAGVIFHLDTCVLSVDQIEQTIRVTLENGEEIESDLVLSAIGLKAQTQLAEAAGLPVNRGIVVNRLLQTKIDNIYALGDCAEVAGKFLPFVMPITHAARALSATLSGNPTPVCYPAMPIHVKTPSCATVIWPPDPDRSGEWHIEVSENGVRALFISEMDELLGFALLGTATTEKSALTPRLPAVLS